MAENVARILRNGLTFQDNFSCSIRPVTVKHNEEAVVGASKPVIGIIPIRVASTAVGIDSFAWYYDDKGRLIVKVGLTGAPTTAYSVTLILLF